jgi:hypothetical protein
VEGTINPLKTKTKNNNKKTTKTAPKKSPT